MKLLAWIGAVGALGAAQLAQAAGGCNLYFSDNNRNGLGSVEGSCWIDQKYRTFRGDSPSFRLVVRGLQYGEQRQVFSRGRLPVTDYSFGFNRGVAFWDANRNGDGTVQGRIPFRNVEDWRSRGIVVIAYIDGQAYRLWQGRLQRRGGGGWDDGPWGPW